MMPHTPGNVLAGRTLTKDLMQLPQSVNARLSRIASVAQGARSDGWQKILPWAVSALLVHLQPILTDGGISPKSAALAVLIIGPASVAGRLFSGILLDHFPPRLIAAVAIILPAMAYGALLLFGGTVGTAFAAALFIGLAAGAESDLLAYMVSRYFRQRAYSSVYSILLGMYGIGYGIAPVAAGAVYDATNSYQPIFIALLVAALAGAGLILALGKPRPASELEEVRSNADQ